MPETTAQIPVGTIKYKGNMRIHVETESGSKGQPIIPTAAAPSTSDVVPRDGCRAVTCSPEPAIRTTELMLRTLGGR